MRKDCNLCGLTELLVSEPHVKGLAAALKGGASRAVYGLPAAALAATVAALARALNAPILLLTAYPDRAMQLAEELPAWLGSSHQALPFPALDALPYDRTSPERGIVQQRLATLQALYGSHALPVVVAPARALLQPLMDPERFYGLTSAYRLGGRFNVAAELTRWEQSGYRAVEIVTAQGEYARRGGIVDIYPGDADDPVRIELFGDEIDSLRRFDPQTQRSTMRVDTLTVTALREFMLDEVGHAVEEVRRLDLSAMLPHAREQWEEDVLRLENGLAPEGGDLFAPYLMREPASLAAYLPSRAIVALDEPVACWEAMDELSEQAREIRDELVGRGELPRGLRELLLPVETVRRDLTTPLRLELWTRQQPTVVASGQLPVASSQPSDTGTPVADAQTPDDGGAMDHRPTGNWQLAADDWSDGRVFAGALTYAGRLRGFLDDTLEGRGEDRRVVIASLQSGRLSELYEERGEDIPAVESVEEAPARGSITLVQGSLLEGWRAPALGLQVFGDAEIFGWSKPAPVARFKHEAKAAVGLDFQPGDYVVHIEHGIGRFLGVGKRVVSGAEREYLELQYAGDDRLSVPTDQLDRVARYVGMGEATPALSKLGSAEWTRAKAKVKESVAKVAQELLELYSYREKAQGHAFAPDGKWQLEMEAAFPYVETVDQQRAIRDVKADMEASRPMDRLVCGDVGYGKTEVALRAAFKAVLDGLQVAVLVPTTILAQQHYQTFTSRLEAFPVRIAVLSRFQSRAQQKETLTKVARGETDIVVGTHRLLQKDVVFKDLGLLVIDEEQRFGVKHKEYLKGLRRTVDVLTLTATPIPRSLHMALVGVRGMSVIETPPEGRLPIRTYLQPFDEYHIREAILRELDRGGQIYFVHNKVQTIQAMAERLRRLVPEARVAIGHGQMPEDELEGVMNAFALHESDLLVCSSIIENGLDIPNVNTMIVNEAPNFGLAQLYQLRGRIGRGSTRAYAYLLYRPQQRITRLAERRLRAIFESTDLGAGFKIAMRDLEIRGAGNLLGQEQSGNMATVGFDLYSRMLAQAIAERRDGSPGRPDRPATAVDVPLDMYIPASYVEHESPRLDLYRRLATIDDPAEVDALDDEMRDRFGPAPDPVENLLFYIKAKALATQARLGGVSLDETTLTVRGSEDTVFDRIALYRRFGSEARISTSSATGAVRGPVLRIPRKRLDDRAQGTNWRAALLTVLAETVAASAPTGTAERVAAATTA